MFIRIRYKLNRIKSKLILLIKNEFENESMLTIPKNKRNKKYIFKIICHPKKFLLYLTGKVFSIKYVEMVLTTVCTLNCKGCSALMEHYKKRKHTDVKMNINALEKMLGSVDSVLHLRLLGGEPLCYPDLYEILEYTNNQEKIKRVTIVTNGTMLINDYRMIEILKNSKFDVYISNYGKVSCKKDELIEQLKKNSIKNDLRAEDFLWRDYGNLECRNRKPKELKKQFLNCEIMCNSIFNGKLHHCPRSTHGMNLKKIPVPKKDYVDLLDENMSQKQLRKELYKFFYKYVPYVEACNYCNSGTKEIKSIPAGVQNEK